jgi:hypothetical protein
MPKSNLVIVRFDPVVRLDYSMRIIGDDNKPLFFIPIKAGVIPDLCYRLQHHLSVSFESEISLVETVAST